MPTSVGPNTFGEDNLVFGYDTGDTANSYRGEPVANDFDFALFTPSGYGGDGTLQPNALDPFGTTNNPVYRKTGKLRFGPTNGTDVGTLYYGKTYTFSIYLRHVPGEPQTTSAEFDLYDRADSRSFSGNLGDNMTYEWKRFSVTAYHNNSSNYHFVDLGVYQGTNVFEWCCPQIEENSHMTPFTAGTRSATQGLIDLTGNSTIDLTNVSFDSNAQMEFDGTDDSVLVGTVGNYSNNMTVEAVFKTSSSTTWKNILCGSTGDIIFTVNGAKLNFGSQGSNPIPHSNYSTTDVNDGQWHHGVATYNGSQVKIYVDGDLESTNSRSGNQTPSSLRVGSNNAGSSEFFNGDIPLVKLYNRALTASEIKANYNAIKGRFNI